MNFGILELYCGASGKKGYYNNQEIGLAKALVKLGYNVYIFYPDTTINKYRVLKGRSEITIVHCPAKAIGVHSFYSLNILKKFNIEILQLGSDNQIFAPNVIKYCKHNNILQYNYIGTIRSDSDSTFKSLISNQILKRNIKYYRNSKCIVKTTAVQEQLTQLGVRDITIAPVGLDTSIIPTTFIDTVAILNKYSLPTNKHFLLFVGRIETYKNPYKALNLIKSLDDNYHLIMIGTGTLDEEIDKEIQHLNIQNKITRIKSVKNDEIHNFYKIADYFINLNNKEIFGMAILEAMYHGVDTIALRAPGPNSIIENNVSGFLVDNTDEIAQIISSNIHLNKDDIKKRVNNTFTWDSTAHKINSWVIKHLSNKIN